MVGKFRDEFGEDGECEGKRPLPPIACDDENDQREGCEKSEVCDGQEAVGGAEEFVKGA